MKVLGEKVQTKERSNTPVASSTPVHRGLTVWSLLPTPPPHAHLHSQCWLLLSVFIFSASFSFYLSYLYLSMHCKAAHFLPQALSVSLFTPTCILTHSQSKLRPLSASSPHSDVGHPHYLHNAVCALQVPHESIKLRVVCGTDTSCKCKCNHNNNNDRRPSQPMPTCMWTRHLQHQWAAIVANVSYHMSFTLPCVHKSYFCTLPLTFTS